MIVAMPDEISVRHGDWAAALTEAATRRSDFVLLVEQSVRIAPHAISFVEAAITAFAGDDGVVAVALGRRRMRPGTRAPWSAVEDGSDAVLVRGEPVAALAISPPQAARALAGTATYGSISNWLEAEGRFIAEPRTALARRNRGDPSLDTFLSVAPRRWQFVEPQVALACYDSAWELTAEAAMRLGVIGHHGDFIVDLWGTRPVVTDNSRLLLSSRPCRSPIQSFPLEYIPIEFNLRCPGGGDFFALGRADSFDPPSSAKRRHLFRHVTRYNAIDDYVRQFLGPFARLIQPRRP